MTAVKPGLGHDRIVIAHGGGGELMGRLIREHLLPPLRNERLAALTDSAVLPWPDGELVFTTDSYVVTPLEFPGGDIGRLAVAGTVNDLAVAREAGVEVVTGDTKVIERGAGTADSSRGLFINTAGVGRMRRGVQLGLRRVAVGDAILVNGPIAEHGLAVMSVRSGIEFESTLRSDVAPLNGLIRDILATGADVKFLRDATRGGIAGVLADICEASQRSVEIVEAQVPLSTTARHAAEMLGLDPLTVANEGKCIMVVAAGDAERVLAACRGNPLGRGAASIGRITDAAPPLVELITRVGGRRVVQRPYGEELPRIC